MNIQAFIRKLLGRNTVGQESFVVVCAVHPEGVSAQEGFALRDIFNAANPEGWWFLNPGTFEACFRSSRSEQAQALATRLREFRSSATAPALGVGIAEGSLICEFLPNGKLSSLPLGNTVSHSLQAAHAEVR